MKLKPVHIDGALYVSWSMLTAVQSIFSGEEAYKYVNPWTLFWVKTGLATIVAGTGALKMFRNTAVSDGRKEVGQVSQSITTTKSETKLPPAVPASVPAGTIQSPTDPAPVNAGAGAATTEPKQP